jgi:hypothetical protein
MEEPSSPKQLNTSGMTVVEGIRDKAENIRRDGKGITMKLKEIIFIRSVTRSSASSVPYESLFYMKVNT